MKKKILTLALVLSLLVALVIPASVAMAADEGTVTCTVSGKLISLAVADGGVGYGILALSGTQNTVVLTDTQVVTNDGTVIEDFDIKSSDAVGATDWTLEAAIGADQYTHEASIDAFTTPIAMTDPAVYVALDTNVATSGTVNCDLRITMPSSVTEYGAHTITVTILATES